MPSPLSCTVTITIQTSGGSAADTARAAKSKKPVKLATGKLTLKKAGKGTLTLKLTSAGKKLLKKDHDKLKATLLLSTKTAHGTFSSSSSVKISKAKRK